MALSRYDQIRPQAPATAKICDNRDAICPVHAAYSKIYGTASGLRAACVFARLKSARPKKKELSVNSYRALITFGNAWRPRKKYACKLHVSGECSEASSKSETARSTSPQGGQGGKLSNCLGQQTTVLVCATAVPTKGSERLLATRPQSRARGRRTKAAATSGCYSLQAAPHQASAEAQHSRQDARERRRGGHHRRL